MFACQSFLHAKLICPCREQDAEHFKQWQQSLEQFVLARYPPVAVPSDADRRTDVQTERVGTATPEHRAAACAEETDVAARETGPQPAAALEKRRAIDTQPSEAELRCEAVATASGGASLEQAEAAAACKELLQRARALNWTASAEEDTAEPAGASEPQVCFLPNLRHPCAHSPFRYSHTALSG